MKRTLFFLFCLVIATGASAKKTPKPQEVDSLGRPIKTGWNFGILPSVAYDADYGFQGGIVTNVYDYGDGSQYPEYRHSIYFEGSYSTKHHGIVRLNYDTKALIPDHRLTIDLTYLPDATCDFYGFNGYQSVYNSTWNTWKKDASKMSSPEEYRTRVYYKYKRDMIRAAADLEGTIKGNLKWNAGLGVLGYMADECNISMLNGKKEYDPSKERYDQKALDPDQATLYRKYQDWGLLSKDEVSGGWHPYLRGGITYDTRDRRQCPNRGIYADAFLTYTAAFNGGYGQQASAGYNNLQLNLTFRHYVPLLRDRTGQNRITFAYRLGTQNLLAGHRPFYMQNYLNSLFIQRVYYEGLGGGNSIRGMMANRVLADGFAYANLEFRFRVVNFDIGKQHFYVGLNPFFDIAEVTQPCRLESLDYKQTGLTLRERVESTDPAINPELKAGEHYQYGDFFSDKKSDIYRPHLTAGVGLKIGMNENFVLSADWAAALNKQDNGRIANFYVKMGYLF